MKFLAVLLLMTSFCYGQAWSGILSPSRAIDWSHAGLPPTFPDNETTPNPWTPPTRAQCGPTLTPSGGDDVTQITNAFNGVGSFSTCTPPYVVVLGSGNFQVNSFLRLGGNPSRNNITLRGSGPMNTSVAVAAGQAITTGSCCVGGGKGALTSASANYTKSQTSLLLQNVTGTPFVGAIAHLVQCDNGFTNASSGQPLGSCTGAVSDPLTIFHCSDALCASNGNDDPARQQDYQLVRITSATNTGGSNWTVTISPGLYLSDWTFSQGTTLAWDNQSSYVSIGAGLEDMTVRITPTSNISIGNNGYANWMKGIRELGSNNSGLFSLFQCLHCLVSNNALYGNDPSNWRAAGGSPLYADSHGGENLFLNNIGQIDSFMDDAGNHQGIVVAYNYSRDSTSGGDYQATLFEHGVGSQLQLRESNQFNRVNDDDTNGTHNLNTDFRENLNCGDTPYDLVGVTGGGIQYGSWARFENSIGNSIGVNGMPAKCPTYQGQNTDGNIWNINGGPAFDNSGLTLSSAIRWGNVSTVTQSSDTPANSGIRFVSSEVPTNLSTWPNSVPYQNSVPANNNLPCSFFLPSFPSTTCTPLFNGGTGLNWWKVCTSWTTFPTSCSTTRVAPFPANGPDILTVNGAPANYANDIPAAVAWKNLPTDTNFQASYTVTGSSWLSGTETLTVTTPVNRPMGGFLFTGANSGCLPTSGVSFTGRPDGEIIISGSSSTTIRYALASNPGVICTGTVKWPDIRQFDERVYALDTGGSPTQPPAPTGFTFIIR